MQWATALDLNIDYHTMKLYTDASRKSIIIFSWAKHSCKRLLMNIAVSPKIIVLKHLRIYSDVLLVLMRDSFGDHLERLEVVLSELL